MYSIRTTFNKLEDGQFFTFRKNGIILNHNAIESICYKVDDSYICDAFLDKDGIESDVMYIAAYRSCIQNNEIRSLSNKQPAPFYNISDVRNNIANRNLIVVGQKLRIK